MEAVRIVGISGNVKAPSRTSSLVRSILGSIEATLGIKTRHIDLVYAAPVLFKALRADQLDDEGKEIVSAVEAADILVVGSPVYRASYTGALKHLFDLVHFESLVGKPVILAATGGSPLHGLVTEHQLRPLFGFFKALTLPTAIYALESDFDAYAVKNPEIAKRIEAAVRELDAIVPATPGLITRPALEGPVGQTRLRA
ncbi:FMN reductase [Rhizobium sp. KVB221]|uniref:FMN reductase n=1 Tax=Rhizobium setariae TaxID=2801340 RepID=A0A937CRH7_9HYPH|nr:FMN reductase [Rhizobium setariae]MBL0375503.1 FMN reductase [Rhizobium setariae]